ncbi:MAG: hypothetical protein ACREBA_12325, partial [Nitrosotalea sp.]
DGTNDSAPAISNTALDNMKILVQYGGKTNTLTLDPSDDTPGLYTAALTPGQLGTYNIMIQGTINGTTIPSTTYSMQPVEAKDNYYFPPVTGNTTGTSISSTSNQTTSQVSQTVVNHLESDITDAKNSANTAVQSYARVAQSFQEVKDSIDTLYMVTLAGIGIGVAGVIIAVVALTRKTS